MLYKCDYCNVQMERPEGGTCFTCGDKVVPVEETPATDHLVDDDSYLEARAIARIDAVLGHLQEKEPDAVPRVLAWSVSKYGAGQ